MLGPRAAFGKRAVSHSETCLQLLSTFGFRSCVAWSFPSPFFCKADFVPGSDEAEARYIAHCVDFDTRRRT